MVVQLARIFPCQGKGRGFESRPPLVHEPKQGAGRMATSRDLPNPAEREKAWSTAFARG